MRTFVQSLFKTDFNFNFNFNFKTIILLEEIFISILNYFLPAIILGGGANTTEDVGEICGASFCPSTKIMDSNQKTADSTVKTLMGIYLVFGCLAIAVVFLFLDKIEVIKEQNGSKGICDLFIATLKHVKKNNKMKLLIPITMFSGLEQGFVFADFTKVFSYFGLMFSFIQILFSILQMRIKNFK